MRYIILLLMLLAIAGCPPKEFRGDDRLMLEAAHQVCASVNEYHLTYAEWPETLEDAKPFVRPGDGWPVNPYNHTALADTGSKEFDAATSVGMVYYEKFYRDDRVVNYQMHVFGKKGRLMIIGNSAFGAK